MTIILSIVFIFVTLIIGFRLLGGMIHFNKNTRLRMDATIQVKAEDYDKDNGIGALSEFYKLVGHKLHELGYLEITAQELRVDEDMSVQYEGEILLPRNGEDDDEDDGEMLVDKGFTL